MKIFLMADLEGASGVVNNEQQAHPGGSLYHEARRYLLSDVQAACSGALAGGADEVIIFDMHYFGLNLDLSELPSRTRLIMGKPRKVYPVFQLNQPGDIGALFMIGYHAMAGAPGGLLTHTYDHSMKSVHLNGTLVGEIGMEAAIAGCYGVPLAFLSGDAQAIEEQRELLGPCGQAVVKYPINEHAALCLPLAETRQLISDQARQAVQNLSQYSPYRVEPPCTIEVSFFDPTAAARAAQLTSTQRISQDTVLLQGNSLPHLWETFIGGFQGYE